MLGVKDSVRNASSLRRRLYSVKYLMLLCQACASWEDIIPEKMMYSYNNGGG